MPGEGTPYLRIVVAEDDSDVVVVIEVDRDGMEAVDEGT